MLPLCHIYGVLGNLRTVQRQALNPLYTTAFRRLLRDSGVKPLVLPAWSPNLNAFAERFVESAKSECLDRLVLLGEGHLQRPSGDLSSVITKNGRTKAWATRSSRPRRR